MSDRSAKSKQAWLGTIVADEKAPFVTRLKAAVSLARAAAKPGLAFAKRCDGAGPEAIWAQSALTNWGSGHGGAVAKEVQAALKSSDPEVRRSSVEASGLASETGGASFWMRRATRASFGSQRSTVMQLAGTDRESAPGLPVLRVLSRDRDPALRERALWRWPAGKIGRQSGDGGEQTERSQSDQKGQTDARRKTNEPGKEDKTSRWRRGPELCADAASRGGKGFLRFEGPSGTQVQNRQAATAHHREQTRRSSVGEHHIVYPGGQPRCHRRRGQP